MLWSKPEYTEVNCGMEVTSYNPADDDGLVLL